MDSLDIDLGIGTYAQLTGLQQGEEYSVMVTCYNNDAHKTKPEADRYLENMKKAYVDSYNDTTVDLVKATISARIKKIQP